MTQKNKLHFSHAEKQQSCHGYYTTILSCSQFDLISRISAVTLGKVGTNSYIASIASLNRFVAYDLRQN